MKYLDLFLKQYRISLSHQKGIEISGIILFLKLMTLCKISGSLEQKGAYYTTATPFLKEP